MKLYAPAWITLENILEGSQTQKATYFYAMSRIGKSIEKK